MSFRSANYCVFIQENTGRLFRCGNKKAADGDYASFKEWNNFSTKVNLVSAGWNNVLALANDGLYAEGRCKSQHLGINEWAYQF